jgi:hypothetical protein
MRFGLRSAGFAVSTTVLLLTVADPQAATKGVCTLQVALAAAGYDPGPIDCVGGPRTRAAVAAFRKDGGLEGQPAEILALALRHARVFIPCRKSGIDLGKCLALVRTTRSPATPFAPDGRGRRRFSSACDDAYASCQSECSSDLFDYETGNYFRSSDFESDCEDACAAGASACEDADRDDRGDEFRSACESECPSDVFDSKRGDYRLLTSADEVCSSACESGASEVE